MVAFGVIFGRMRLTHRGHLRLIDTALAECGEVFVGISESSRGCRSVEYLQELYAGVDNVHFIYSSNAFTLMTALAIPHARFYVGADRANMVARLGQYHSIEHRVLERHDTDPSSTACRIAVAAGADLVQLGLARDSRHADIIINQYNLEQSI